MAWLRLVADHLQYSDQKEIHSGKICHLLICHLIIR